MDVLTKTKNAFPRDAFLRIRAKKATMAIKNLREALLNLRRLREVVMVLYRHGFGAILWRLGLDRWLGISAKVKSLADDNSPQDLAGALEELGATYIKFGQVLATRPDILPTEYITALSRLQDKVEPLPFTEMKKFFDAELPRPRDEIFSHFDENAIASGSIGQVYYATLITGEAVVVKIKRPGTDARMHDDLSLLKFIAGILQTRLPEAAVLSPKMLVDEFARCLLNELDFVTEAAYTEKFAQVFAQNNHIKIPQVYWEYTSRNILVAQRLHGTPLSHSEKIPANVRENLADTIAKVFLEQYFLHGFFHADPHPGNLLFTADGRLGIIDCGQIGQLSKELQRNFVGLLLALSHGDIDAVVNLCGDLGVTNDHYNLREFRSDLGIYLSRFYSLPFKRLNIGEVINEAMMLAQRHGLTLPHDLILLAKSLTTIQGVVRQLSPEFRLPDAVQPFIKKLLAKWLSPKNLLWDSALYAYRCLGALKRLPEDVRDILQKAGDGKLRIIFHHEGLETVGDQVERASNRITLGLLIAAILLGSSIVLAVSPEFMNKISLPFISDIPLSAIVAATGYLSAMGLGFWLAWAILRGKRL